MLREMWNNDSIVILFAGKLQAAGAGLGTGARLRGGEMERRRLVPSRGSWNV